MRSVVKYDCTRDIEVSLVLNSKDKIIGVEVYFEEPIDIVDFRLEDIFAIKKIKRSVPATTASAHSSSVARKTCGGCK